MVDSEHIRLAVEIEEEKRARLENVAATNLLSLAMKMNKKKIKTGEDGIYRTAHVSADYRCGQCGCGFVPKPFLNSC